MAQYKRWRPDLAAEIVAPYVSQPGSLLPILHALQHEFGYIPDDAVPIVAQALNVSRADVHGVLTFYPDYRRELPGAHVLKLCQAESCQARGGRAIAAQAQSRLGVPLGETTADGAVTVEPIYCLGLCATAPSAMLDGRVVGRLDEARIDALVAEAQR